MTTTVLKPIAVRRSLEATKALETEFWQTGLFSKRSPSKNTPNEDSALIFPIDERIMVLAVADGCGGMRDGEVASSIAIGSLRKELSTFDSSRESLRATILRAIEIANHRILKLGTGSATTLAVVEIGESSCQSYHVGDSMVLILNADEIRYQSVCHSPVGYAVESGWLNPKKAMFHDDRHLVSNVLGSCRMRIEIGPQLEMQVGDSIVVASDGLFDNLRVDEVVARFRSRKLHEASWACSQLAIKRMNAPRSTTPSKPDDLTIIAARKR